MSVLGFLSGFSVPSPRMFSLPPNPHRLHRVGLTFNFRSKTSESSLSFLFSRTPLRHTKFKLTGFLPSCCVFFLTIKTFTRSSVLSRSRATAQQAPRQVAILSCACFLWSNTNASRFSQQGLYLQVDDMLTIENVGDGLSWWLSGKASTHQFRRHIFHPWSEKIPGALRQQSLCTATAEPAL